MSRFIRPAALSAALIALAFPQIAGRPAHAQVMDLLNHAAGAGQSGTGNGGGLLGGLGSGGIPSIGQASPSNITGVLQYCIQNNYLRGRGASLAKDSMMSRLTGSGKTTNDSGFKAGSSGLLETGKGQTFSLGGDGIKQQITQKVCDQVLQHAKTLL